MHLFSGCVSIVVEWSSLPCFSPIYIQKSQLFPFYSSAQLITRFQLCVWLWLWVCISVRFDLHSPKKTLFNDNSSLCEAVCHMSARLKEYEASKLSHVCNRDVSLNTSTGKLDFSLILLLCILASGRRNETPVCVRVWVRIFAPVSFFFGFPLRSHSWNGFLHLSLFNSTYTRTFEIMSSEFNWNYIQLRTHTIE